MASSGLSEAALSTIALENSGRDAALWALARLRAAEGGRPVVIAGQGGVGAAALAAARHLFNWGLEPRVHVIGMKERLRDEAAAGLALLDRFGARFTELLNSEQAAGEIEQFGAGDPLVYGAAGDAESQRATDTSDLVNRLGGAREASRAAAFSVRARTAPPGRSEPRVRVRAGPRDRESMRLLDSTAIKEYGVPSLALMENAGFWAARELWRRLEAPGSARVAVLAGRGNNGGDGFVIARHLAWWGVGKVTVYLAGASEHFTDDARVNFEYLGAPNVPVVEITGPGAAKNRSGEIASADWVVDALLGTGLAGKVRGVSGKLLELARGIDRPVFAVDTPSGLDATDGTVHGVALAARATVTFGVPKTGFTMGAGPEFVGELSVAEISLPRKITGGEVVVGDE